MKGSYILIIKLENDVKITIGKLGDLFFNKGFYVYVGSAINGLEKRIQRHLRMKKKTHWHIDYILKHAKVTGVFYKESTVKEECAIAKKFEGSLPSVLGFGCSDCKCKSHLFYGGNSEIKKIIDGFNMKSYFFNENY